MLEVGTGFHPELTGRENIFLNGVAAHLEPEILLVDEVLAVGDAACFPKEVYREDGRSGKGRANGVKFLHEGSDINGKGD